MGTCDTSIHKCVQAALGMGFGGEIKECLCKSINKAQFSIPKQYNIRIVPPVANVPNFMT